LFVAFESSLSGGVAMIHERAAKEGAEAAKRRQQQLEKEVREYHERDGRQMDSGGKQPLDQLLASGAAHQRCYVHRRKRVEDDRAKVAEEEARLNELEHVRVQERRDWHAYRRGRFRNGKGQWMAGESRYPSQRRGGGSDCGSTMD
jgi:hypothetical protein